MNIFYHFRFVFTFIFLSTTLMISNAQEYLIDDIDGQTINTCTGFFLDSGGASGNYGNRENFVTTICPDNTTGTSIQLRFAEVDLFANDELCFFDGPDINSPPLDCAIDFDPDGPSFSNVVSTPPFLIQATVDNPSGCITISFNSNGLGRRGGWRASIRCIPVCQQIQVGLASSTPTVNPIDTGWIDACPGQPIALFGEGIFPQEGQVYNHADSSIYRWDFGDGRTALGRDVTHVYEESGGYTVQLSIIDQFGCTNTNFLNQRVRVAPKPSFQTLEEVAQSCVGDTIALAGVLNGGMGNVMVTPTQGVFQTSAIRSDSLSLPDGDGTFYETSVSFSNFTPGQSIENIDDLESICMNIEHSYVRDLEIELFCPNGQSVVVHQFIGRANKVFLGEPVNIDSEFSCPVDRQIFNDDGTFENCRGVGYDYCWTSTATNPTWLETADDLNSNESIPPGDYTPFQSFNNLVGCPLNGEWTLRVTDDLASDNGFIFFWGLNFNPLLFTDLETFTPDITSLEWIDNPNIIENNGDNILATPLNAGSSSYTLSVMDEFGCTFDTSIVVSVLPPTHPDCIRCEPFLADNIRDTTICEDATISLDAGPTLLPQPITFEASPNFDGINANEHTALMPYESGIDVSFVTPDFITNAFEDIISVCVDIEVESTEFLEDLTLVLVAPDGGQMTLFNQNGGVNTQGVDLNICFTPSATNPINTANPPFTGNYQPIDSWGNLDGQTVTGTWQLLIADAFGTGFTKLNSWSITFNNRNQINYSWSPADGLSCTNCPNPEVNITAAAEYIVNARDAFGCEDTETLNVNVLSDFIAPPVDYEVTDENEITFTWVAQAGVNYEISINGAPFELPNNGNESHIITGLAPREVVDFELRPIVPNLAESCTIQTTAVEARNSTCRLRLRAVNTPLGVSCPGDTNGSFEFSLTDATLPYQYFFDGQPADFSETTTTGTITDLSAGPHQLVVIDGENCTDTLTIDIPSPEAIVINAAVEDVKCNGGDDGQINTTIAGGTMPYTFNWSTGAISASLDKVVADEYILTVTDANGCIAIDTVSVSEPDALNIDLSTFNQSCFDISDGSVRATTTGGTGTVTFRWSNGGTFSEIGSLEAGEYIVTATDENGCEATATTTVGRPQRIRIINQTITDVDCNGNSTGGIIVEVEGGVAPYGYLWDDPLAQNTATATQLSAGIYNLQVTDANDCRIAETFEVQEPEVLTVSIDKSDVNCFEGEDGIATAVVEGGVANYGYEWSDPEGQNTATITDLIVGNYMVTVTDANDCIASAEVEIVQPLEPISATIEQTFLGCHGERQNEARVTATGGTGPNYEFIWSDGQTGMLATGLDTFNQTVTVRDERGCRADFTTLQPIEDLPEYIINIIATDPSCNSASDGVLGVNVIQGGLGQMAGDTIYSYSWNFDPDLNERLIENVQGGRIYSVTVTDPQGCQGVASRPLDQPDPIRFDIDSAPVDCFGAATGRMSIDNISGGTPFVDVPYTYLWSTGDNTTMVEAVEAGSYTVTVFDANNCETTQTVEVTQPTAVTASFDVENSSCFNSADGAIQTTIQGGIPTYELQWSTGSVTSRITDLTAGTYTLTVTDANNCELVTFTTVDQPDAIQVTTTIDSIICAGGRDGGLTVEATGGSSPYTYGLDGENFAGSNDFIGLKADRYTVFVRDINGCIGSTVTELFDPPAFTVNILDQGSNAANFLEINMGDSLQLFASAFNQFGEVEFVWTPLSQDSTMSCMECEIVTVKPDGTIYYELYGIDENGCEATDEIQIRVRTARRLLVPTGFSPNGDLVNDLLYVHGTDGIRVNLFQLYDRYGELLYEREDFDVNDLTEGWDGTFRGEQQPAGVYVWLAEVQYENGIVEYFKGQTTLIK